MSRGRQAVIQDAGNAMQAYQRSTQAFDDAVGRALGLNPTDLRGLDWLADGAKTAGELSAGTGLSSAATTTLIDRLEARGFARRVADPTDRGRVLVEMTTGGPDRSAGSTAARRRGRAAPRRNPERRHRAPRQWLVDARELTDRQRDAVRAGTEQRR